MNIYLEITNGIYDTFVAKLNLLRHSGDNALNSIANDLLQYVNDLKDELEAEIDDTLASKTNLIEFKNIVELMIDLFGLLIASTKTSSIWAIPLIEACYKKLDINLSDRKILAIHTLSRMHDNRNTFGVHIDILKKLPQEIYVKINGALKIDVFEIPSESQFNLSSLAILGHEVGHVLWYSRVKREKIKTMISELVQQKYNTENLFDSTKIQEEIKSALAHTEELFCDCVGRFIFGIVYDVALLKAFCFGHNGYRGNSTHPPHNLRTRLSRTSIEEKISSITYPHLSTSVKLLVDNFKCGEEYTVDFEEGILRAVEGIKETYLGNEHHSINTIWENISKELDAFRPPVESVTTRKPKLFQPIEILIGSVLYAYCKQHYIEHNAFFKDSTNKTDEENEEILLQKLKEHVIYTISNYNFLRKAYDLYIETEKFEEDKLSHTLWSYRERLRFGTTKGVFSVIPSTYPNVQYGQSSVDIRLGSYFLIHKPSKYIHISPYPEDAIEVENFYEEIYIPPAGEFILHPHQFVLASTLEYVSLPIDYYGLILGRSSWGRLGLTIATATTVQAGFKGCITLELKNVGETPLPIKVGNRIAQLCLIKTPEVENTDKGYYDNIHAKYIGPIKAEIPKIKKDIDWELLGD